MQLTYYMYTGIVGMGNIGKAVARRALGFSMEVIATQPTHNIEATTTFAKQHGVTLLPLAEVLARADVLSLHGRATGLCVPIQSVM